MKKKLIYTNRKGTPYYFREVNGKRGVRIVCSQRQSEADLSAIPDTHEVVESPNAQVSCRKKMISSILPEEIALTKKICTERVKKGVRVKVEIKKKAIIIHSADTSDINELAKAIIGFCPSNSRDAQGILENNLRFEAVLKLELVNLETRTFAVYRMRWTGTCNWLFLNESTLPKLLKKYVPHIELDSFYDLV